MASRTVALTKRATPKALSLVEMKAQKMDTQRVVLMEVLMVHCLVGHWGN